MVRTVGDGPIGQNGTQAFQFQILAPLYLRPWALLLETFLIALILYLFYRWQRIEAAKETERVALGYQNRMYALEQQSLNSSMNRHFIFNSLNAIQFYINKEEKREANRYLTSFAKLIRKNLDSTTEVWVSLKDELERTILYLDLEMMRFSERFTYSIHIDDGLDTELVRLPSMTMQPYLENSIWHGLLPKESKGKLAILISLAGQRLCISIEDDGIGIEQSLKSKGSFQGSHESRGLKITDDRMKLFHKMTGKPYEVVGPEDLMNEGKVIGTRTLIFIPMDGFLSNERM
jgi:sensor histidine kinase YesM